MPDARGACRAYDWDLIQFFPRSQDLPHRGRGTARRRWKEFVTLTRLRGIATMRCICNCVLYCCRLGNGESSSADDGTRSARPRGLGGLKPCARCAGKSMAEIGNRKERLRDYASFPDDFDLPRSKVATRLLPFAWDAPPR